MFPGNCATRFEICFLISSNMYINHAVLKRQLAQWVQLKSFTNVSAAARYTTLEDIRRHVCCKSFIVSIIAYQHDDVVVYRALQARRDPTGPDTLSPFGPGSGRFYF